MVSEGPTAKVEIRQEKNKVTLYQSIDNEPVKGCETSCSIPTGIPVYFMTKSEKENVPCPVNFQLILPSETEKSKECYSLESIRNMLKGVVRKKNILCKVNVEYAFFKVYGDGCIVSLEADKNGLRERDPEIRLLPLEKQRIRYYLSINDQEKSIYSFAGDRKGKVVTPEEGDKITFIEERD